MCNSSNVYILIIVSLASLALEAQDHSSKESSIDSIESLEAETYLAQVDQVEQASENESESENTQVFEDSTKPEDSVESEENLDQVNEIPPEEDEKPLDRTLTARRTMITNANKEELFLFLQELELDTSGTESEMRSRLYEYYELEPPEDSESGATGVEVIIDAADTASVFQVEGSPEQYVRFFGGVRLTLVDKSNNQKQVITADSLVLNKDNRYMSAIGSVRYELQRSTSDEPEVFEGSSVTINIDSWEGVFVDGISETNQVIDGLSVVSLYRGDTVVRQSRNAVTFSDLTVTTGEDPSESYFSLSMKKMWFLNTDEWAILSPVASVGHVPFIWFPFYFQPGYRLFFRPHIGIHTNLGFYINTTTYIFGKPSKESGASLSLLQIDSSTSTERELDGLFLVPRGEKSNADSDSEEEGIFDIARDRDWMLKIYADLYARRGVFLGLDSNFPDLFSLENASSDFKYASISNMRIKNYYAFTRTLFTLGENSYGNLIVLNGTVQDYWEEGIIFGRKIPFRFLLDFSSTFSLMSLDFDTLFQLYSDTTIANEFIDRSESFSWDFALGNRKTLESVSEETRTEWKVATSYDFSQLPVPTSFAPTWEIIDSFFSLNISNLEVSYIEGAKSIPVEDQPPILSAGTINVSVPQKFFAPLSLEAPSLRGKVSGSIFSYPLPSFFERTNTQISTDEQSPAIEDNILVTPWEEGENGAESDDTTILPDPRGIQSPTIMEQTRSSIVLNPFTFDLTYSVSPSYTVQSFTNTEEWERAADIDYDRLFRYSNRNVEVSGELKHQLTLVNSLFTNSGTLKPRIINNKVYDFDTLFLDDDDTLSIAQKSLEKNLLEVNYLLSTAVYPLKYINELSESRLSHTLEMRLYEETFETIELIDGEYQAKMTPEYFLWDDTHVLTHTAGVLFKATYFGIEQAYEITTTLPPKKSIDISPSVSFEIYAFSTSASIRINDVTKTPDYDPLVTKGALKLSFFEGNLKLDASQEFQFLVDEPNETWDYSESALSIVGFKDAITFRNSLFYNKILPQTYSSDDRTWSYGETEEFSLEKSSHSLEISYTPDLFWKNRITFDTSIGSTLSLNYNRFTNSELDFTLSMNLDIHDAFSLKTSLKSSNTTVHLYNKEYADILGVPSRNLFSDLWKSLNIFDTDGLEETFFKIRGVEVELSRVYRDWSLSYSYKGSPKDPSDIEITDEFWENYFQFTVSWNTIKELTTSGEYRDDEFTLLD